MTKPGPKPRDGKTSLDRIEIRVSKNERKRWQAFANKRGASLATVIRESVELTIRGGLLVLAIMAAACVDVDQMAPPMTEPGNYSVTWSAYGKSDSVGWPGPVLCTADGVGSSPAGQRCPFELNSTTISILPSLTDIVWHDPSGATKDDPQMFDAIGGLVLAARQDNNESRLATTLELVEPTDSWTGDIVWKLDNTMGNTTWHVVIKLRN
jgi:hypothetical protein